MTEIREKRPRGGTFGDYRRGNWGTLLSPAAPSGSWNTAARAGPFGASLREFGNRGCIGLTGQASIAVLRNTCRKLAYNLSILVSWRVLVSWRAISSRSSQHARRHNRTETPPKRRRIFSKAPRRLGHASRPKLRPHPRHLVGIRTHGHGQLPVVAQMLFEHFRVAVEPT